MLKQYTSISETLKSKLYDFVTVCNTYDNCNQPYMLDNDIDFFEHLPKFFILEINDMIYSFVSIFFINESTVYLYGFTHPEYRKKGFMKQLLNEVRTLLLPINITNFFIPISDDNKTGKNFMHYLEASLTDTECLMICTLKDDNDFLFYNDVQLLHTQNENILEFTLHIRSGDTLTKNQNTKDAIGHLYCMITNTSAAIFDVEVSEHLRGNGYGAKLLELTKKYLKENGCNSISLHVTKENTPAYQLYKSHGFVGKETILYFALNTDI